MITFFVRGKPEPQGSTKGFNRGGKVIITTTNKNLHQWRDLVAAVAQQYAPAQLIDGPIRLGVTFWMPRPKTTKRIYPTVAPDLDKLIRAIGDALTNVIWVDDSRVVEVRAAKRYASESLPPGIRVEVEEM